MAELTCRGKHPAMTASRARRPSRSLCALSARLPASPSTALSGARRISLGEFRSMAGTDRVSKLFGEDDEALDEAELDKAQAEGENG